MAILDDTRLVIRPFEKDDEAFIYSTWKRAHYHGNGNRGQPKEMYQAFDLHKKIIDKIMKDETTTILVASDPEVPSVIYGYSIFTSPDILHFVYVKGVPGMWREMGLAKKLIPTTIKKVTHLTSQGKALLPISWTYEPIISE